MFIDTYSGVGYLFSLLGSRNRRWGRRCGQRTYQTSKGQEGHNV